MDKNTNLVLDFGGRELVNRPLSTLLCPSFLLAFRLVLLLRPIREAFASAALFDFTVLLSEYVNAVATCKFSIASPLLLLKT